MCERKGVYNNACAHHVRGRVLVNTATCIGKCGRTLLQDDGPSLCSPGRVHACTALWVDRVWRAFCVLRSASVHCAVILACMHIGEIWYFDILSLMKCKCDEVY